jgi:hypothetical protein
MDYDRRAFELFKSQEPGAVYKHKVWDGDKYYDSGSVFSSYEKALAAAKSSWNRAEIKVCKIYLDDTDGSEGIFEAEFDDDGNLCSVFFIGSNEIHAKLFPDIDTSETGECILCDIFFIYIPVPFKDGDILTIPHNVISCEQSPIFVLDHLDWNNEKRLVRYMNGELGDGTDMTGWGFFISDDGVLFGDNAFAYDSFKYYKGKLEGKDRLLHYVSLYIKDEIGLPELLTMQCRLIAEHQLKNNFPIESHGCYIPEQLLVENRKMRRNVL